MVVFASCAPPITGEIRERDVEGPMDTFRITVRLPPSFASEPDRRFPWILQLDGRVPSLNEFDTTARLASEAEARGELEEVVIVGINSATGEGNARGRNRDYTIPGDDVFGGSGGAADFHHFLGTQLIPSIEDDFHLRKDRDGRALFGHSLGGLFGAHALTQQADAPLFGAIVAASPSLIYSGGAIHQSLLDLPTSWNVPRTLVLTAGTLEGPEMVVPVRTFAQQARDKKFSSGIEVTDFDFPVDHINSIEPSFKEALRVLHSRGWDAR
ncbi:MAG: alpha/beta hydrolase-fold protein [Archangium sp.]